MDAIEVSDKPDALRDDVGQIQVQPVSRVKLDCGTHGTQLGLWVQIVRECGNRTDIPVIAHRGSLFESKSLVRQGGRPTARRRFWPVIDGIRTRIRVQAKGIGRGKV